MPGLPVYEAQENLHNHVETYRALYDFTAERETELSLSQDDLIEVIRKDNSGMSLP